MDLRIATAILILLSIFLYTTASNEHQTKHDKVYKHLETHKRRKLIHKVLSQKKIDQNTAEKQKKPEEEIANNKINTTEKNPQGTVNQTSNQQEIIKKEENEVNQTKINSQIEEPPIPSRKSESNIGKNEYIIGKENKPLNETNKPIREVIFINGIHDILKLLAKIGLAALDNQMSQNLSHKYIHTEIPEEKMNKTIGLRKLLGKGTKYQSRKTVLLQEDVENKNISKHKQSSRNEINEEEIISKHVTTKESKKNGKQHKKTKEESVGETIKKPKKITKYIIVQNEDPASSEHLEVEENSNDTSEILEVIENYIINKTNTLTPNKNLKQVVIPESTNGGNKISKSKTKIKKYVVTKIIDPSEHKQFADEISGEDLSKFIKSGENVEVEEHVYTKDEDSEPKSIEKFIYIENKYPSSEKKTGESVTNKFSRKNSTITSSDVKSTARKQFQEESKDIIEKSEDGSIKQKTDKAC